MQLAVKRQERDDLIEDYRQYVKNVALKMLRYMNLPLHLLDEFIAAGYLGLVEAAERYEPNSGKDFKRYAFLRIRGAIIDSIRNSSQLSGKAYQHAKSMQRVVELQDELQCIENSTKAVCSAQEARLRLANLLDVTAKGLLSFRLSLCEAAQEINELADGGETQEENLISREEVKNLFDLVETLPQKERLIIRAHYFYNKSFNEIVDENEGMSKSWVSRLHARALERLKETILAQRQ